MCGIADASTLESMPTPSYPSLTARERETLSFVAEGKTDWEIAIILGLAEPTVRFHIDNARRKFGAVNRVHAVARFLTADCCCGRAEPDRGQFHHHVRAARRGNAATVASAPGA